jgi:hypothetical protein
MGFFSRLAGTAITLLLAAGAYQYLKQHHVGLAAFGQEPLSTRLFDSAAAHDDDGAEHFSPSENLERLAMDQLKAAAEHARAAKRPLDIAIYAFTDRTLAALLVREADQGTAMRIYRDGEQYETKNAMPRDCTISLRRRCSAANAIFTSA